MPDLYLSRLTLLLRNRDTQRLLGDCHAMHRLVMSGFPDVPEEAARNALGVLYRVEPRPSRPDVQVLVQSRAAPRWAFESRAIRAEGPQAVDAFLADIEPGRRYRFRLHANPTRRVHPRAAEGKDLRDDVRQRDWSEQPGAVRKRVAVRDDEARLAWLARKGESGGFVLAAAKVAPGLDSQPEAYEGFRAARSEPRGMTFGRQHRGDRRIAIETCTFEGVLDVTDPAALREAIAAGVGPGKAFGCGLLSLAPV